MKSRWLKVSALLISVVFVLTGIVGCGANNSGENETTSSQPAAVSDQTVQQSTQAEIPVTTLKMFIKERWPGVKYDNFTTHYIEEKTNTKWELTVSNALEDKLNVILASGEKYDIIQYGSDTMEMKLQKAGLLYPINKSFDKYPNLQKYGDTGGIWDCMTYPDGNIYTVPIKDESPAEFLPIYRQDWLDKLGLKVPTTLDEYYDVAVAMANNDPDGNGKKDTYAFGAHEGFSDARYYDLIFGAFGVHPPFWLDNDGHLINSNVAPGAKEALKYLNKLYKAGAIDPEFVTDSQDRYKTKFMSGKYGAACYKIYLFDTLNMYNYYKPFHDNNPTAKLVTGPLLTGYTDKPLGMTILSQRGWLKTGIMSSSQNVDASLRVLDWLASEEGTMFENYGVEGQDYTMENGTVKIIDTDEQMKERGVSQCYLAMDFLYKHVSPEYQKMNDYIKSIAITDPTDGIIVDEMKNGVNLDQYTKTQYVKMIVGTLPVEGGFETYVKEWNKKGGEALTKAMDTAYQQKKGN